MEGLVEFGKQKHQKDVSGTQIEISKVSMTDLVLLGGRYGW